MIIPTREECIKILKERNVPHNVIAHSETVCRVAVRIADILQNRGIIVDRPIIIAGALLHDIEKTSINDHIIVGYELVKSLGFPEVALLVKKHGLAHVDNDEFVPKTWEEKIVFYADKRVKNDRLVSVDERFEYIRQRYNRDVIERELELTKKIEMELIGDEKIE